MRYLDRMGRIASTRRIDAPVDRVFQTVSQIENFAKAIPAIVKVEFVTPQHTGVGTRFRETRRMGKREATVELEVKEFVANDRIRLVADAGGTVWDTVFSVKPAGGATELSMVMDDKPYRLPAKLFNPLLRGMIRKNVERDMDAVKAHCERSAAAT
jgi:carbon monoxide dehydrogenase subunit G